MLNAYLVGILLSAFYICCICSSATSGYRGRNTMNPDLGPSVCNIGYLRTYAEDRADNKSCDWCMKYSLLLIT